MKNICTRFLPVMLLATWGCVTHTGNADNSAKDTQNKYQKAVINLQKATITNTYDLEGIHITEGYVPFREFKTHFRIAGDFSSTKPPLLLLHGGPGSTHNYFEVLDSLAKETDRLLISYDQLGCGDSYVENRPDLWVAETWVDELDNLINTLELKRFHLLGQSWGGMLAITYLADRTQKGVVSVILSSSLSESQLWGIEQRRMAQQLPQAEQKALAQAEETNDYNSPAYLAAIAHYMQIHCNDQKYADNAPQCLRRPKRSGTESYMVAWGPNELTPTGTLADWNYTDKLPSITIPSLIISGTEDLCTPLIAKTMFDKLPNARWELLSGCRHMCFIDTHTVYCDKLKAWFKAIDPR